jgi:taurine dehydrogenase small subunit
MTNSVSNNSEVQANADLHQSIIKKFSQAWKDRDLHTLLSLVADDCVYTASVGPGPGEQFVGKEAVCKGFTAMFANDQVERVQVSNLLASGDRAACEWRYFSTDKNDNEIVIHGCDLYTFTDDKISVKDSFRKTYPRVMPGDIYDGEEYRGAF